MLAWLCRPGVHRSRLRAAGDAGHSVNQTVDSTWDRNGLPEDGGGGWEGNKRLNDELAEEPVHFRPPAGVRRGNWTASSIRFRYRNRSPSTWRLRNAPMESSKARSQFSVTWVFHLSRKAGADGACRQSDWMYGSFSEQSREIRIAQAPPFEKASIAHMSSP